MNNDLILQINELAHTVADAQYEVDVLEAIIKKHTEEEEMHRASFVMANAGDQYKALSSSSTVSLARKAIEADILARHSYVPLYDTFQEQIDLAAAQQRLRVTRSEHTMYTMRFYGEFADVFGTMKSVFTADSLNSVAMSVLPIAPTPARVVSAPKPWESK